MASTTWKVSASDFGDCGGLHDLRDELVKNFSESICKSREKLARNLMASGHSPSKVNVCDRIWFDEESNSMLHECFVIDGREVK
jgi:hypothetical protein